MISHLIFPCSPTSEQQWPEGEAGERTEIPPSALAGDLVLKCQRVTLESCDLGVFLFLVPLTLFGECLIGPRHDFTLRILKMAQTG